MKQIAPMYRNTQSRERGAEHDLAVGPSTTE